MIAEATNHTAAIVNKTGWQRNVHSSIPCLRSRILVQWMKWAMTPWQSKPCIGHSVPLIPPRRRGEGGRAEGLPLRQDATFLKSWDDGGTCIRECLYNSGTVIGFQKQNSEATAAAARGPGLRDGSSYDSSRDNKFCITRKWTRLFELSAWFG